MSQTLMDVLGMNARNLECIYPNNHRKDYPLVDNKKITKDVLSQHGFPIVPLLAYAQCQFELPKVYHTLHQLEEFVIKPAHGFGGGGIKVIGERIGSQWLSASKKSVNFQDLAEHCDEILFGVYSIDNSPDQILIEPRIKNPERFAQVSYQGLPDIRMIVTKGQPVMAMLRLPTRQSDGRANLHVGGIGVGIDLQKGVTTHGIQKGRFITHHPDTQAKLSGIEIPHWEKLKEMSCAIQKIIPLGYMGLDWVLDDTEELYLLELNARPGIEIQNANRTGLRKILRGIK